MVEVLRRSLLYVPASSEAMVGKAGLRGADVVILDLEDGVAPEHKDRARDRIPTFLAEGDFGGAEVLVRANHPSSRWGASDLEMLAEAHPAGVLLPKVESPATVAEIDRLLGFSTPLFAMVETVAGVLAAEQIAAASPRLSGLLFGAADYRESVRAGRHPEELELLYARSRILLAARGAGVHALDSPWFAYRDLEGLERSALRVRQLGFDGKTAIHPLQVPVINRVFSPTRDEIGRARRIIDAMAAAAARGAYVATVDGEMVEALHLEAARRTLDIASRLALADS